jgi:hypothetical protein
MEDFSAQSYEKQEVVLGKRVHEFFRRFQNYET